MYVNARQFILSCCALTALSGAACGVAIALPLAESNARQSEKCEASPAGQNGLPTPALSCPPDFRTSSAVDTLGGVPTLCPVSPLQAGTGKATGGPGPHVISRIGITAFNHSEVVRAVAFSPDAKQLASVTSDGIVRLWTVPQGKQRLAIARDYTYVDRPSLAFSPDGKFVALGGDIDLYVWRTDTGANVLRVKELPWLASGVAFSSDGSTLSAWSRHGHVGVWEVPSGKEIRRLDLPKPAPIGRNAAYAPDRKLLAIGRPDRTVTVVDTESGKTRYVLDGFDVDTAVVHPVLQFSPDGRCLSICESQRGRGQPSVHVFDADSGKALAAFGVAPCATDLSPNAKLMLTATLPSYICLWDIAANKELRRVLLGTRTIPPTCVALAANEKLAAVAVGQRVEVWDLMAKKELSERPGPKEPILTIAFLPDHATLGITTAGNILLLYDSRTGKQLHELARPPDDGPSVRSIALAPDGKVLASAIRRGTIGMWELPDGKPLAQLQHHPDRILALRFSPGGGLIACEVSGGIFFLDGRTGKKLSLVLENARLAQSAFSPDNKKIATIRRTSGETHTHLKQWPLAAGEQPTEFLAPGANINTIAYSPTGDTLATGCDDKTIRIWDLSSGRVLRTITLPDGYSCTVLCYAPDGKTITWGGAKRIPSAEKPFVQFLSVATGKEIARLPAQLGGIACLAFSADRSRLAIGGIDNTVETWDLSGLGQPKP
jgi:WD40 repeat protein